MTGKKRFVRILYGAGVIWGCSSCVTHSVQDDIEQTMLQIASGQTKQAFKSLLELAKKGHVKSMYLVGECYFRGEGTIKSYDLATLWYMRAAAKGDVESQFKMGQILELGLNKVQSFNRAAIWYEKAAQAGLYKAQLALAGCCLKSSQQSIRDKGISWLKKISEYNDVHALYTLGNLYKQGELTQQSDTLAFKYFSNAADLGMSEAQAEVGEAYLFARGVNYSLPDAEMWFTKAADRGSAKALYYQALIRSSQSRELQALIESFFLLQRSAAQGYMDAEYSLGHCYEYGKGTIKSHTLATIYYLRAAVKGHTEAQYSLGLCYEFAKGIPSSVDNALLWYGKAARNGHSEASFNYALLAYNHSNKSLHPEAYTRFMALAKAGDPRAENYVGLCFENAIGVRRSFFNAFVWYLQSASNGNMFGKWNLARCYDMGRGVKANPQEAFKWYLETAKQGYAPAMNQVAFLYEKGVGVEQSLTNAFNLFKRSALKGNVTAIRMVGHCYESGKGCFPSNRKALKWYKRGLNKGDQLCALKVYELETIINEQVR